MNIGCKDLIKREVKGFNYPDPKKAALRMAKWTELSDKITNVRNGLVVELIGPEYVGHDGNLRYLLETSDRDALIGVNATAYKATTHLHEQRAKLMANPLTNTY
jgi:hypothetical protein